MVAPATVTDCPPAETAEERVLNAAGRPVTVDAEYRDVSTFDCVLPCLVTLGQNPGTAAELFGRHGPRLYAEDKNAPQAVPDCGAEGDYREFTFMRSKQ
jgi:hypothetical protein